MSLGKVGHEYQGKKGSGANSTGIFFLFFFNDQTAFIKGNKIW